VLDEPELVIQFQLPLLNAARPPLRAGQVEQLDEKFALAA
jgi:hypothetical protein